MRTISIIYAYRNREINRIELSLNSIEVQRNKDVEIIFIDYGSDESFSERLKKVLKKYEFVQYYYLDTREQLWNKSRALNYGIRKSKNEFIFIADVDLIFPDGAINKFQTLGDYNCFYLFNLGYLNKKDSENLKIGPKEQDLVPIKKGNVNGMLFVNRDALFQLKAYDEFYHFYGSEDVDLCARLENAGYQKKMVEDILFFHIWHEGYQKKDTPKLSLFPRLSNALRINQQHYFFNKNQEITIPLGQKKWGVISQLDNNVTNKEYIFSIKNGAAEIDYYINEVLSSISNGFVIIEIRQADYFRSLKYFIKSISGKQNEKFLSMKEVNDYILKKIIFNFRYHYYSYTISSDLKMITFKIQL